MPLNVENDLPPGADSMETLTYGPCAKSEVPMTYIFTDTARTLSEYHGKTAEARWLRRKAIA